MGDMMDHILSGYTYRATVCYMTTLTGRALSVANVIKLRCNIFSADADAPPLAIKVYWNRREHGDKVPVKGDVIEVYTCKDGLQGPIRFKPLAGKDKDMAMNKDRVRFHIRDHYFNSQERRMKMGNLMARAFDMSAMAADSWMHGDGFWVTCRPSQFARFLIYRNEAGITNGFKDLHAKLVDGRKQDIYDVLARKAGVNHETAKRVSQALSFNAGDVEAKLTVRFSELDVSEDSGWKEKRARGEAELERVPH